MYGPSRVYVDSFGTRPADFAAVTGGLTLCYLGVQVSTTTPHCLAERQNEVSVICAVSLANPRCNNTATMADNIGEPSPAGPFTVQLQIRVAPSTSMALMPAPGCRAAAHSLLNTKRSPRL
jgi:hypothetical protein